MFSALAENHGNLNSKISAFVALAPVASLHHGQAESEDTKYLLDNVAHYTKMFSLYEYGQTMLTNKLISAVLPNDIREELEQPHVSGASLKQQTHFNQIDHFQKFQKFDYGEHENQKRYGTATPPRIKIEDISVPIGMFVGKEDVLASTTDNRYVRTLLKTVDPEFYVELDNFDHSSFQIAEPNLLMDKVIKMLNKYDTGGDVESETEPTYNTEEHWHMKQNGEFSIEEHILMGIHKPTMDNSSDKKHYVEKVGSLFASGFFYGGNVGLFDPMVIAGCLNQEDMANTFFQADKDMKRSFEEKDPEVGIKALEDMMRFVAMMLKEFSENAAKGQQDKVCKALAIKKDDFK